MLRFLLSVLSRIHFVEPGRLGAGYQGAWWVKASLEAGLPAPGLLLASAWLLLWAAGEAVLAAALQLRAPLVEEAKSSPLLLARRVPP